ncbi:hypothetical protein OBRU01_08224 [Operophtera brumata]|uniref:DDRGK domain-containing protein 1 n=1 Tax=Operophtera brumata TaxID=104452 RepID=A0A0L7LID9_OPEBR|nr:hypothetical protein OBRU01_08224 [Operophtera brumata]
MDPFIIAAIISAIVILILSVAFLRVSQVKPQAGGRPRPVAPRDGGPGRVQAVRNQRARMRANAARHQDGEEEPEDIDEADEDNAQDAPQKVDLDDKMGAKAEEEKKRREQEEYDALKAAFSVESEGFEENDDQDQESLLKDFIDYIKTQAAIDRITDLQSSGELTGVIDDRGKFIYISQKELEDVAKFIRQRGRVSITDLAESSNDLINLNPVIVP